VDSPFNAARQFGFLFAKATKLPHLTLGIAGIARTSSYLSNEDSWVMKSKREKNRGLRFESVPNSHDGIKQFLTIGVSVANVLGKEYVTGAGRNKTSKEASARRAIMRRTNERGASVSASVAVTVSASLRRLSAWEDKKTIPYNYPPCSVS